MAKSLEYTYIMIQLWSKYKSLMTIFLFPIRFYAFNFKFYTTSVLNVLE